MTYYYESDGPINRKAHTHPEQDNEREFIKALKKEWVRINHLNEGYAKMPYDGIIQYKGEYIPYEAKHTTNKALWSMKAWRSSQGHQLRALQEDYQDGCRPFMIIFWEHKKGDVKWCIATIEDMLMVTVKLAELPVIHNFTELLEVLEYKYGH